MQENSGASDEPEFCPDHGDPDDPAMSWPCPLVYEGESTEKDNCKHFMAELERRSAEVAAGHFYELTPYDEDGNRWFVGHGRLAGERRIAWSRKQANE